MKSLGAFLLMFVGLISSAQTSVQSRYSSGSCIYQQDGLHGYISYSIPSATLESTHNVGVSFYVSIWAMLTQQLADLQLGFPCIWIQPNNSDDKFTPLAPPNSTARNFKDRGPTWSTVFQTIEGGVGYWAGNHFRYGFPKFSMNGVPQCYDYEVGSPGWPFFKGNKPLPDNQLSIAQLSNKILIPPDGLTFDGHPNGEFLGYAWMALPFTDISNENYHTGDQSWTCFLNTANFKGPIAFFIPETWSKVSKVLNYSFDIGRGLDSRTGVVGGGAIEMGMIPRLKNGVFTKIPELDFPVDSQGRTILVQDVSFYSKNALFDSVKKWRDGGASCDGSFKNEGLLKPLLTTQNPQFDAAGGRVDGIEKYFTTKVFEDNKWGLVWNVQMTNGRAVFPQYYRDVNKNRIAVDEASVPTNLRNQEFKIADSGDSYSTINSRSWTTPGPSTPIQTVILADGSKVSYAWYKFIDQPAFQQYNWPPEKRAKIQSLVEKIHQSWPIDRNYIPPPSSGKLVNIDSALLITPPKGMELGYVPIVLSQSRELQ